MRNITQNQISNRPDATFKTKDSAKGKSVTILDLIALHDVMVSMNTFPQWRDGDVIHRLRLNGYLEPETVIDVAILHKMVRKIESGVDDVCYYQWIEEVARPVMPQPVKLDSGGATNPQFEWIPDPHVTELTTSASIGINGVDFSFHECIVFIIALRGELKTYQEKKGVLRWNVEAGSIIIDSDDLVELETKLTDLLGEMVNQIRHALEP